MSAANGKPQVSRVQFYNVCSALKKIQAHLENSRPTIAEAADMLSDKCGFGVSVGATRQAMNATGITWKPKRIGRPPGTSNHMRAVVYALVTLYRKLGEDLPAELSLAYVAMNQQVTEEQIPSGEPHV